MVFALTRKKLETSRLELAEAGFPIMSDEGEFEKDGFEAEYRYDSEKELLTVTLLDKPWYLTAGFIRKKVTDELAKRGITPHAGSTVREA
jgi:hypothetical protein